MKHMKLTRASRLSGWWLCSPSRVAAGVRRSTGGGTSTPAPAVITVDGSSTVFPVTEAVAEEFQKLNAGTQVTVGRSGTGGGFQKFCRNETVVSNASRPIAAAEIDACKKGGIEYIELPVAYDGMAVVVNTKNNWAPSMTVAELKKLWSPDAQGKVLRWNQFAPAGQIRRFIYVPVSIRYVRLFHRSD